MVSGPRKLTKAKRSRLRVRRTISPGEYHKVKLSTASGGSLTIRYRKRSAMPDCCSGESCSSGEAEASSHCVMRSAVDSQITSNADVDQTFENLTDLPEYCQSSVSMNSVPFDGFGVLYSSIQPDFSAYHFWSLEDCSSSEAGSNETFPEFPAESIDVVPKADHALHGTCLLSFAEEPKNPCAPFEDMYSMEQSIMLGQQLKAFNEDIEVASTLVSNKVQQGFWPVYSAEMSPDDQIENSNLELIELPPPLRIETGGTICSQDVQDQWCEVEHESARELYAGMCHCTPTRHDSEQFDQDKFLVLDPGMPEQMNEVKFVPQSPWSAFLENALQEVTEEAVQGPLGKQKCEDILEERVVQTASGDYLIASRDSEGQGDSRVSFGPVATRGKKLRKKRMRRTTPLHTVQCLLSGYTFTSHFDHLNLRPVECNGIQHELNVSGRRSKVIRKGSKIMSAGKQEYINGIHRCEVTKCSDSPALTQGFLNSSSSQVDLPAACSPPERGIIAHPEKVANERSTHHHAVYRSVREVHNSLHPERTANSSALQQRASHSSDDKESNMLVTASSEHKKPAESRRRSDPRRSRNSCLLPETAVSTLRKWFDDHIGFPFADKDQKRDLVSRTGLKLSQVENWLSNYRHRLKVRRSDYDGKVFCPDKAWNPTNALGVN